MKTVLPIFMLCMILNLAAKTQSTKDLPAPTSNLVTLATGSYVIPMDNSLQLNAAGFFNLKSYGLIVHLLNNNVKVKWVIKAGKAKDAADFTVNASRVLPTVGTDASRNFIAGPFVVYAADTTGVAAFITTFYTANSLTGNDRPSLYITSAPVTVDVRYDLFGFIPKAAVLKDGANTLVHYNYYVKAAVPKTNYDSALATDLLLKCYTFASEPHNDVVTTENIRAVKAFVDYGNNFLAQCEAVLTYENHVLGHFHSTVGITKVNTNVAPAALTYTNADLAYSQFQGTFDIAQGGSVRNWVLSSFSSFQNNAHHHANNNVPGLLPIGASVAKLNATNKEGGLIFYVGNHEFASITTMASINGMRMYLNAFLTPTSRNRTCKLGDPFLNVLPLKIEDFLLSSKDGMASVSWMADADTKATRFIIERSEDGNLFTQAGVVFSTENSGAATPYKFKDLNALNSGRITYYRIKSEDATGKFEYSVTKSLRTGGINKAISIATYPNPVTHQLNIQLPVEWNNKVVTLEIMTNFGQVIFSENKKATGGVAVMNVQSLAPGYYFIKANCQGEIAKQGLIKR